MQISAASFKSIKLRFALAEHSSIFKCMGGKMIGAVENQGTNSERGRREDDTVCKQNVLQLVSVGLL